MPVQEQIVLLASNDDVFALLKSNNILPGIYAYRNPNVRRAKINMNSAKVTLMNANEIDASSVGSVCPIRKFFRVVLVNNV